jgi:hypothetical protein
MFTLEQLLVAATGATNLHNCYNASEYAKTEKFCPLPLLQYKGKIHKVLLTCTTSARNSI